MVIIGSREGQFANRVFHFAHVISAFKDKGIPVVHLHFQEFLPLFPHLKKAERIHTLNESGLYGVFSELFILFIKILIKLKIYNLGFLEVIYYDRYDQGAPVMDLSGPEIQRKAKTKILVLYGWLFRDVRDFERNRSYILDIFAIKDEYEREAKEITGATRAQFDVLVGVHIRRGDYKHFEKGRWFYEDSVYTEKMHSVAKQFAAKGKQTAFVLCSNEDLDLSAFQDIPVFHSKNPFVIDLLLLSKTDFIIGPPSTFSAMASFFGGVPLQFIYERDSYIQIEKFEATAVLKI